MASTNTNYHTCDINTASNTQLQYIKKEFIKEARTERALAVGTAALGIAGAIGVLGLSVIVAKVAMLILAFVSIPLLIFPPAYFVAIIAGGLGLGAFCAYKGEKLVHKLAVPEMTRRWNHATELYTKAEQAHFKLAGSKA